MNLEETYFWAKSIFAITIVSFIGAKVSKEINLGHLSWYWYLIPGLASGAVWALMATHKGHLARASIIYDVVMSASYLAAYVILGDKISTTQGIGILISMVGVVLMGL